MGEAMSDHKTMFQQQKQFMVACGQTDKPNLKQVDLYVDLIKEEFGELTDAWNAAAMAIGTPEFDAEAAIVETVDGIIDTMVVLYGTLVSMGEDGDIHWNFIMGDPEARSIFQQISEITSNPIELSGVEANECLESLTVWINAVYAEWESIRNLVQDYENGEGWKESGPMVLCIINAIANAVDMLNSLGINGQMAWDEVLSSNMTKLDPETGKAIHREDGKILKPESFRPVDLLRVVKSSYGIEEAA